jgi:hypothetical protein
VLVLILQMQFENGRKIQPLLAVTSLNGGLRSNEMMTCCLGSVRYFSLPLMPRAFFPAHREFNCIGSLWWKLSSDFRCAASTYCTQHLLHMALIAHSTYCTWYLLHMTLTARGTYCTWHLLHMALIAHSIYCTWHSGGTCHSEQDRQCICKVPLRRVRATTVAVDKQWVLHIVSVRGVAEK